MTSFLTLFAQLLMAADSYSVPFDGSVCVREHNDARIVYHNSPNSLALYVPTRTAAEWTAFRANPPAGVTLSYLPSCEGNLRLWLDANDSTTLFQASMQVGSARSTPGSPSL